MLRCTIELIPHGIEERRRTIGLIEIANDGTGNKNIGNYKVILKKTFPWAGALKSTWRKVLMVGRIDDDVVLSGGVEGFHRQRRGPYDLLYKALKACGMDKRN